MKINKLIAALTSIWFSIVMLVKKPLALIIYPIAYSLKDWIYGEDKIENYKMPTKAKENLIARFFWLFLDDDQVTGYCPSWAVKTWGILPNCKIDAYIYAYGWSAYRNPAYNVNYVYFGNQSKITHHVKAFGNYEWNRKLRRSNGDSGHQLVWFLTEKQQSRFIYSVAKQPFGIPFTMYFGWNPNFNGRFTVAVKLK